MFYRPWKVEKGVAAVPFEVVWNRLVGFCWVVQLSGWLRFSCWTSSRSLEDDRACVARSFPWCVELEAATLLHEELDEKRGGEKPGWTACCDAGERLSSPWPSERFRKNRCAPLQETFEERETGPLPFSSERVRGESEEGENMLYIGPVTSQVMGLRVTNGSWNLCLLSVFTPLCDAEAPGKLSSFTQACTWRPNFVHQKPCPNTVHVMRLRLAGFFSSWMLF